MNGTVLCVEGLHKEFTGRPVLRDINFSINSGESVGLIGANGAGKTTLIKCILDFCVVDSGVIHIYGVDHRRPEARNCIAFLPERFAPPYYLCGRDFFKFMAALDHSGYNEQEVMTMIAALDLDPIALEKPVRQFSQGMGQKLGLAACFLKHSDLVILDEPMNGLDPLARARLKKCLATLKREGKTLFYSTHLLDDVQALCDRVIILHDGLVRFMGRVGDCCAVYRANTLENAYLACINPSG